MAWVRPSRAPTISRRPSSRSARVRATRSPVSSSVAAASPGAAARRAGRSPVTRKTISPCSSPAASATAPPRPSAPATRFSSTRISDTGSSRSRDGRPGSISTRKPVPARRRGPGEAVAQMGDHPVDVGFRRGLGTAGVAEGLGDQPLERLAGRSDALELRPRPRVGFGPGELADPVGDVGQGAADVVPEHRHLAFVPQRRPDRVSVEGRIKDAHDTLRRADPGAALDDSINLRLKTSADFQPTLHETIAIGKRHSAGPLGGEPSEDAVPEPGHVARRLDDVVKEFRGLRRPERNEQGAGEAGAQA